MSIYICRECEDKAYQNLYPKFDKLKQDLETHVLLTKQECLALVEIWDHAYLSPESSLAYNAFKKISNFAISK